MVDFALVGEPSSINKRKEMSVPVFAPSIFTGVIYGRNLNRLRKGVNLLAIAVLCSFVWHVERESVIYDKK